MHSGNEHGQQQRFVIFIGRHCQIERQFFMTVAATSYSLGAMVDEVLDNTVSFLPLDDVLTLTTTSSTIRASLRGASSYWQHVDLPSANSSALRRLIPFATLIQHLTCRKSTATEEAWIHFASHTRSLRVLDVSGSKSFTDVALAAFVDCNTASLVEIHADNCVYIESIAPLIQCAPRLRTLSLNRCRQLVSADMTALLCNTRSLGILNLKGLPKVDPVAIITTTVSSCPDLKVLALGGSGRFSKDSNMHLSAAFNQDVTLQLECLDISCSNPFGSRSPLGDDGLLPLLHAAPNLKELHLKGHSNLSRAVLEAVPRGLKALDLTGCAQLSVSLDALAQLTSLEALVLYACPNVPDTIVQSLKVANANLTHVDMDDRGARGAEPVGAL
ncbi:Aste57867_12963 [Aphanomyces stellatus]|uniref:Aste57867_12963 protein n=1 Tax=Aphanomyces stellatus TaxID=120398 RepID=A0A485KZ03_9STRA|nr:hypothetical protein As57867_012915 [Aphanomyces stellatus]VFT89809.1 Aste57867_12963 [Aphanomyces stellatus]